MMRRKGFLTFLMLLSLCFSNHAEAANLNDVLFATEQDTATMLLPIEGQVSYKVFTLENPPRMVVDLKGANWAVKGKISGSHPFVKKVRHGKQSGSVLRLVIDLKQNVSVMGVKPVGETLKVQFRPAETSKASSSATPSTTESESSSYTGLDLSKLADYGNSIFSRDKTEPQAAAPVTVPVTVIEAQPISTPSSSSRKPVIVIDPGHGGKDSGAIARSGTYEKTITLRYAQSLKKKLEDSGYYIVHLTRTGDSFIELKERVALARKWKADMFISVHADAHVNPDTRGLSVYTISEDRADRETRKLYDQANKKEVVRGVELRGEDTEVQTAIIDFARNANTSTSSEFAAMLVKELGAEAQLLENPHRTKSLAVLTDIDITSVLVELGYMSNRYEENKLRTKEYQDALLRNIKDAIDKYFSKYPVQ